MKAILDRKATLTKNQENDLCSRIFYSVEVGYSLKSKTFKLNVYKYCDKNGILQRFSKGSEGRYWLKSFLEGNTEVKRKRLKVKHIWGSKGFIIEDHFAKMQQLLVDKNLLDLPEEHG